ncbi:PleD family two-component system response regulator [Patescibacteria group bacterium]
MVQEDKNQQNGSQSKVSPTVKREGVSILIIEDDKFLRELIGKKLLKEGYEVLNAVNGEEGLASIKDNKPRLLLLDLLLPGMNGFDVLAKMKEDDSTKDIPVIILSNIGSRDDIERAKSLGARDYLIKAHFTPQEVVEKAEKVIKETYL